MNLIAIQKELLKKPIEHGAYEIHDDKIYFSLDGYVGYVAETKNFLIDPQKVFTRKADGILRGIAEVAYTEAHKTVMVQKDKSILQKIRNQRGHAWIDSKNLKYFGPYCTFGLRENGTAQPVAVYEDEKLVGFILPVRFPEEDEVDK